MFHMLGRSTDTRALSPPVVKVRLIMNVHNLKHCARGALGGTAVVDVVFLQRVSPRLVGGGINKPHPVTERASSSVSFVS